MLLTKLEEKKNLGLTEKVENLIPGQITGRALEHAVVVLVRVQHIPSEHIVAQMPKLQALKPKEFSSFGVGLIKVVSEF